jgi:hypothetical protein
LLYIHCMSAYTTLDEILLYLTGTADAIKGPDGKDDPKKVEDEWLLYRALEKYYTDKNMMKTRQPSERKAIGNEIQNRFGLNTTDADALAGNIINMQATQKIPNLPTLTINKQSYKVGYALMRALITITKDKAARGFAITPQGTVYHVTSNGNITSTVDDLFTNNNTANMCKNLGLKSDCVDKIMSCIVNSDKNCIQNLENVADDKPINASTADNRIALYSMLYQLGWFGEMIVNDYKLVTADKWIEYNNADDNNPFHNALVRGSKLETYLNNVVKALNENTQDPKFVETALKETARLKSQLPTGRQLRVEQLRQALYKKYKVQREPFLALKLPFAPFVPIQGLIPMVRGFGRMTGGGYPEDSLAATYHNQYEFLRGRLEGAGTKMADSTIHQYETTLAKLHEAEQSLLDLENQLDAPHANLQQIGGGFMDAYNKVRNYIARLVSANRKVLVWLWDNRHPFPVAYIVSKHVPQAPTAAQAAPAAAAAAAAQAAPAAAAAAAAPAPAPAGTAPPATTTNAAENKGVATLFGTEQKNK